MTRVDVDADGPMFDGAANIAVWRMIEDAKDDIGGQGLAHVHDILDVSIRNPTPYYETQVTVERWGADVVAHDREIIYGRWLEGISSRNTETSFKGYHAFRRATDALEAGDAQRLLERQVALHIGEMS